MKGKEGWKKIDGKRNSVDLLKIIKEIALKFYTGQNVYMTTWKVKLESANMFHNNEDQKDTWRNS